VAGRISGSSGARHDLVSCRGQGVHVAVEPRGTKGQASTHDWREAGVAWGRGANDWSCLYEHYSVDVILALFPRLGVGPTTELLDIACGSGLALRLAAGTGASVSGIDAAPDLVQVALLRTPEADVRVGSMYELPWASASFDAAVSINGIWGGCDRALDEAFRVLRPGGLLGLSFWGPGPPLDIRTLFRIFAIHAPKDHRNSMVQLNDIANPGVAEEMLTASGFTVLERGSRTSVVEWPDAGSAWRAISSIGPAVPALSTNDESMLERQVMEALEICRDRRGIYRTRNDHQFVVARKP
jgi:SAM-dependent methyltransferase